MLIKWIHCTVSSESKAAFARAQESWSSLVAAPGFLGQLGGWSADSSSDAFVLGFWADRKHYDGFMSKLHDKIVEGNRQLGMLAASSVVLVNELIAMPGTRATIDAGVAQATFLRVADCVVRPGQSESFVRAQREVWLPGMQGADGMVAGSFGEVREAESRYLVATLWADESTHGHYARHILPGLVAESAVRRQTETVDGTLVRLEPAWTVLAA